MLFIYTCQLCGQEITIFLLCFQLWERAAKIIICLVSIKWKLGGLFHERETGKLFKNFRFTPNDAMLEAFESELSEINFDSTDLDFV